ncbi:GntR family transcriptional regulator [Paenarthrobacter ureafaciens]
MTAAIRLDLDDPVPPYEQIRRQLGSLITVGALEPGSRLPTVRSLAADLGIAAGTVARAYKELEQSGLIESRRRNGTIVVGPPSGHARPAGWRTGGDGRRRRLDPRGQGSWRERFNARRPAAGTACQ